MPMATTPTSAAAGMLQYSRQTGQYGPYGQQHVRARSIDGHLGHFGQQAPGQAQQVQYVQDPALVSSINNLVSQLQISQVQQNLDFTNPSDILAKIDPDARGIFLKWFKDFKALVEAFITHRELKDKYAKLTLDQSLLKQFQGEAKKGWLFLNAYQAHASPIVGVEQDDRWLSAHADANLSEYKVDLEYLAMRKRHALECQKFIFAHQEAALRLLNERVNINFQKQALSDRLDEWRAAAGAFTDQAVFDNIKFLASKYVALVFRVECPKVSSRIDKQKEANRKRDEALAAAEAKWSSLDTKTLIGLAVLDGKQSLGKGAKPSKAQTPGEYSLHKPQAVNRRSLPKGGILEHLLNRDDVLQSFGLEFTDGGHRGGIHDIGRKDRQKSQPRSSSNQSHRSQRSASVKSYQSSRSSSVRSFRSNKSKGSNKSNKSNKSSNSQRVSFGDKHRSSNGGKRGRGRGNSSSSAGNGKGKGSGGKGNGRGNGHRRSTTPCRAKRE